ncbi:hypothetical protein VTP01DRAFT_8069 [Rhizomucor pusillus]|uniref:uncharacterized protein n=1 Tax=Rhizomucor pusillus TaxID=4840 RepID=UPI0037435CC2
MHARKNYCGSYGEEDQQRSEYGHNNLHCFVWSYNIQQLENLPFGGLDTKQMTLQLYQLSSSQYSLSAYVEQLLITTCNDFEQETRPMNVLQR